MERPQQRRPLGSQLPTPKGVSLYSNYTMEEQFRKNKPLPPAKAEGFNNLANEEKDNIFLCQIVVGRG